MFTVKSNKQVKFIKPSKPSKPIQQSPPPQADEKDHARNSEGQVSGLNDRYANAQGRILRNDFLSSV